MPFVTDLISFNVHERGRKVTGQRRRFNTEALARLINSPATQERCKAGDLVGCYGHWPRLKFGMSLKEGGIIDGKAVSVPLAVRVVEVSATPDGTISHRTEFMDTAEGKLALALWRSQVGGFSSAIDAVPGSDPSEPVAFYGFDYVFQPNYVFNRGWKQVLDAAGAPQEEEADDALALLDAATEDGVGAALAMHRNFDELAAQYQRSLETIARLARENDELVSAAAAGSRPMLDNALLETATPDRQVTEDPYERWRHAPLPALQDLPGSETPMTQDDKYLLKRLGLGR